MAANSFKMFVPQFFGVGCAHEVGTKLTELGCKKVLVMYDRGIEAAGIPAPLIKDIEAAGIAVVTSNEVEADPSDVIIKKIAAFAQAEQVDGVVAVGGGSSLDAAKCVKLLLNNDEPLEAFYDRAHPQKTGIPMIAIPTTSGTGAEASRGSVVTDTVAGVKRIITGPGGGADLALVDPELVLGVPPKITAACAFDVLAHALDAIFSVLTSPVTQILSYEAIRLMKDNYKQAVENGSDLEVRSNMHLAANLGGIVLSNANVSLIHAFAHTMGALYHVPHGTCCAVFLPACLEFVADVRPKETKRVAELLDVSYTEDEAPSAIARRAGETIRAMYRSVGMEDITAFVPCEAEARERIIPIAEKDILLNFCPRKLDHEGAEWIIERTYELANGK